MQSYILAKKLETIMTKTVEAINELIEEIKNEEEEEEVIYPPNNLYRLKLRVNTFNDIDIYFIDREKKAKKIGHIDNKGFCHILNKYEYIANYSEWVEHGKNVSNETIKWRGYIYSFGGYIFRNESLNTQIYDFDKGTPMPYCLDVNIRRLSDTKTPIII